MEILPLLQANPLFKNFSRNELAVLAEAMMLERHHDGHVFIKEGQRGNAMYLILDGEVSVTRQNETDGADDVVHIMHKGEVFGLVSLIDHGKRSATCTAAGEVTTAALPVSAFELLYQSHASISDHFHMLIARQLVHDLRLLNEAMLDLLFNRKDPPSDPLHTVSHEFRGLDRRHSERRSGH